MLLAKYHFEYGSFYFRDGVRIHSMCQEVTIIYDKESGTMLKHGAKESIITYLKSDRGKVLLNTFPIAQITIEASPEGADWINQTLACSGSLIPRIELLLAESRRV